MDEEQFDLDLTIDDSEIDNAIRKLALYERQLKRVSALSKTAGGGARRGGGVGAGSVGSHAGSLGASQMMTQLTSQLGAMKLGEAAISRGSSNTILARERQQERIESRQSTRIGHMTPRFNLPAPKTERIGHQRPILNIAGPTITDTQKRTREQFAKKSSSRFIHDGLEARKPPRPKPTNWDSERMVARKARMAARGRATGRGIFGKHLGGFAKSRGNQLGGMFGRGAFNKANLAKGAVGGMFRRGGAVLGKTMGAFGGLPGFIIGGMLGAAIGGLADRLLSENAERNRERKENQASIEEAALSGGVSEYIQNFDTKRLRQLSKQTEMANQYLKDGMSTWSWWASRGEDGFTGPGWSPRNIRQAREQAQLEYSRRLQGIGEQGVYGTELDQNRLQQTIAMMVRP